MTLGRNVVGGVLVPGSAHMIALGFLCKWRRTNSRGGVVFNSVPLFFSLPEQVRSRVKFPTDAEDVCGRLRAAMATSEAQVSGQYGGSIHSPSDQK